MAKQIGITDLNRINDICNDFEDQIRIGDAPIIETALKRVDEKLQSELFTELLRIELFYCRQNGRKPAAQSSFSHSVTPLENAMTILLNRLPRVTFPHRISLIRLDAIKSSKSLDREDSASSIGQPTSS